jgi:hypothetical protein
MILRHTSGEPHDGGALLNGSEKFGRIGGLYNICAQVIARGGGGGAWLATVACACAS